MESHLSSRSAFIRAHTDLWKEHILERSHVLRQEPGDATAHRALALAQASIPDFLGRRRLPSRARYWVSVQDGHVGSWLGADEWEFHAFRRGDSLEEQIAVGAALDYPVCSTHRPELAAMGLRAALVDLEVAGVQEVYLDLPLNSHAPQAVVESLGFRPCGIRDQTRIFRRELTPATPRRSLYPYAAQARIRFSATAADAPKPDLSFWSQASLYSGFSAYAFMEQLLQLSVPLTCQSFLSVPCATGDALRFLPPRPGLQRVGGIDINPVHVQFARLRLRYPCLDSGNRLLLAAFEAYERGGSQRTVETLVAEVATALRVGDFDVRDTVAQLRAAWRGCVHNAAVADFWILCKGLVALAHPDAAGHPLQVLEEVVSAPGVMAALEAVVATRGRDSELPAESAPGLPAGVGCRDVQLICADFLQAEVERFQCIFVFEALLMFFATGLEDPFLDALLARLDHPGCLVLTGIRTEGALPHELSWAAAALRRRGLQVRTGAFRPAPVVWAPETAHLPFPIIIAEQ